MKAFDMISQEKTMKKKPIDIEKMLEEHEKIKQMMTEMAMPLKVYLKKIDYYMYELTRNWCLCKWCQLFDPDNINFNHWKKELKAFMEPLSEPIIKNNVNKRKHLHRQLVEYGDFNDKNMILRIINNKFKTEKIIDQLQIDAVAQAFAEDVNALIDAIADCPDACDEYIQSTFCV